MCIGSWFQALGPATANARVPKCVTEEETTRSPRVADRSLCLLPTVVTGRQRSATYDDRASPCSALYVSRHSLNWTLKVGVSVFVSATLMLYVSESKRFGGSCPIWDPIGNCLQRVDWWRHRSDSELLLCLWQKNGWMCSLCDNIYRALCTASRGKNLLTRLLVYRFACMGRTCGDCI